MTASLCTPVDDVPAVAAFLGISERSLRQQLEPGGDLEHLAYRAGRRVLVKTTRLLEDVGAPGTAAADPASTDLAVLQPCVLALLDSVHEIERGVGSLRQAVDRLAAVITPGTRTTGSAHPAAASDTTTQGDAIADDRQDATTRVQRLRAVDPAG
jgi:hypothetical protein